MTAYEDSPLDIDTAITDMVCVWPLFARAASPISIQAAELAARLVAEAAYPSIPYGLSVPSTLSHPSSNRISRSVTTLIRVPGDIAASMLTHNYSAHIEQIREYSSSNGSSSDY